MKFNKLEIPLLQILVEMIQFGAIFLEQLFNSFLISIALKRNSTEVG